MLSVFSSEQVIDFRVEGGCIYPEQSRGIEDPECFFPGEFAGEEERWLWNAVLLGHCAPIGLVESILLDTYS